MTSDALSRDIPIMVLLARAEAPDEACGLVYEHTMVVVPNVAADPQRRYAMDPEAQIAAFSELGWPVAAWHSHPRGRRELSEDDKAAIRLQGSDIPWHVLVTPDGWWGVYDSAAEQVACGELNVEEEDAAQH